MAIKMTMEHIQNRAIGSELSITEKLHIFLFD